MSIEERQCPEFSAANLPFSPEAIFSDDLYDEFRELKETRQISGVEFLDAI